MRKREEIEKEIILDAEYGHSVVLNQGLIIEILLDIRDSVNPPTIKITEQMRKF